ncbi:MAG: glycosyltransferase involved in cell wall biosynthesis [Candidatus Latescibacterota bacterium]
MNRVRVLHVITRLDRGGSAENTLLTVAEANRARFDVSLASGPTQGPSSPTEARAREVGEYIDIPDLVRAIRPLNDLRALWQLYRLMQRGRYDIVHTHTSKAGLLGRLAAYFARVPIVVHTPHGHVFYGYYGPWVSGLFVRLERWAASMCDRIIALTSKGAEDHIELGVALRRKFVVIHSGIEFPESFALGQGREELRAEWGIGADALVVGTLGRLTAIKGQRDLIEAFSLLCGQVPDAYLLLVGDGEERMDLVGLAKNLGVGSRVIVVGWREDIYAALATMDLFALPSINEGMGKALVEAMYAGLPCVATRVGGVPELVEDGKEGFIVSAAAPRELADALLKLLLDESLRARCGAAGRRRATAYSAAEMIRKIEALYEDILQEKGL